ISLVNNPLPPASASGRSWILSPEVRMGTSSTAETGRPCAARSAPRTSSACLSASGLPRVPRRKTPDTAEDCTLRPRNATRPCGRDHRDGGGDVKAQRAGIAGGAGLGPPDNMLLLGIETTCDETAAAVVRRHPDGRGEILANVILSQSAEHAAYGGVVPEIAARAHVEVLDLTVAEAMVKAKVSFAALDGV